MSGAESTEALRAGRRALDGVPGVRILRDLLWHEALKLWTLHLRISSDEAAANAAVSPITEWYVHIDPHYPRGPIEVLPAKLNGLQGTFPHQAENTDADDEHPWQPGALCLATPHRRPFGRFAPGSPPGAASCRLAWYIRRTKDWLHAAATNDLLRRGDAYELPAWKTLKDPRVVVFSENASTFVPWSAGGPRVGIADLAEVGERYLAVLRRSDFGGKLTTETRWGEAVTAQTNKLRAFWLRLKETPVVRPWQAPRTWGELFSAAEKQGLNPKSLVRQLLPRMTHVVAPILLVGFEIPARLGDPPSELTWKALVMPPLERGSTRGFRKKSDGQWAKNRLRSLGDCTEIRWLSVENWHPDRIAARGRLEDRMRASRIAVIGVGAVGSLLAEALVRGGVTDLLLVDADVLAIGNLARHRLTMDSLAKKKASAMAEELNCVSPHARIRALDRALPLSGEEARALLEDREIVIDCTGDNTPLETLAEARWDSPKLFVSVSVGYGARRLYFFSARSERFPFESFLAQVEEWLPSDRAAADADDLHFEGAGCWHPVWPGRFDDLMLLSATASKLVEAEVAKPASLPRLQVFERRVESNGAFAGVRRVVEPKEASAT